jgi:hypothetical protein
MPGSGKAPEGSFFGGGIVGSALDGSRFAAAAGAGVFNVGPGVLMTGPGVPPGRGAGVLVEGRRMSSMESSPEVSAASPVPKGGFVVIPDAPWRVSLHGFRGGCQADDAKYPKNSYGLLLGRTKK